MLEAWGVSAALGSLRTGPDESPRLSGDAFTFSSSCPIEKPQCHCSTKVRATRGGALPVQSHAGTIYACQPVRSKFASYGGGWSALPGAQSPFLHSTTT